MITKLKILATVLITTAVIGGGGFYLYENFTSPPNDNVYPKVAAVNNIQYVTPSVDLGGVSNSGPRRTASTTSSNSAADYTPSLKPSPLLSSGTVSVSPNVGESLLSTSGSGGYVSGTRSSGSEELVYSGGGGSLSLLAFGGSSKSSNESGVSGSSSLGSPGFNSGSRLSVISASSVSRAFSDNIVSGQSVGGDPGGDPTGPPIGEEEEAPVGDGLWVLLLFAGIYVFYRRRTV